MVTPCSTSYAGPPDVAGHGEQAGSRGGLGAEAPVGLGAVFHDPRQVGEGFHVVDDRGPSVEPDGSREIGRLQPGHSPIALEALYEGCLLADYVGTGAPVQDDVDREVGAEDAGPDEVRGVRLVERCGNPLLGQRHLAPDVEEAL